MLFTKTIVAIKIINFKKIDLTFQVTALMDCYHD